jgi:hypothetical protein
MVLFIQLICYIYSTPISSSTFYTLLKENNAIEINKHILLLEKNTKTPKDNAYLGALYMRSSNFEKDTKVKVALFKKGATLLETEIKKEPTNVEFRFIRLMIQENAPQILKYNTAIAEDKKIILSKYQQLSKELKQHILTYSKLSKNLSHTDF